MRINVDGLEYPVSCQWHQNDTIVYYVEIDSERIRLDLDMFKARHDHSCHITAQEVREILATQIREILYASSGYRRAGLR